MSGTVLVKNQNGRALGRHKSVLRHRSPAVFRHAWTAIEQTLKAFAEGVAKARRTARLYDELTAMADPELHDIGINRTDIPAVVAGAYRKPRVHLVLVSSRRPDKSPPSARCDQPPTTNPGVSP